MPAQVPASELSRAPTPGVAASAAQVINAPWITPGRFALFLGLLVCASFAEVLLGRATFVFRDYGLFSYPAAFFQRESFWRGELPFWNPLNSCGIPFLAQWNTLALYPPCLIYLLLPLTWALSFFCLAHLFWGGLGMYHLARRWTGQEFAGALAGIIFAFNGLSFAFLMWPSHIATFSWLPWVILLTRRAWRSGGRILVWAALAGTMQMLAGGPETILLTWMLIGLLACIEAFDHRREVARIAGRLLAVVALVALLSAVQLLPFLELLAHSQRDSGYSTASHEWSMPLWGWANFLVPLFRASPTVHGVFMQNGQYWTSSYYAGIGAVLLGFIALRRGKSRTVYALGFLVFLAGVLAWGDTSVLYSALKATFPGLGFVRYPVKFVILILALAPLLAAWGFAALAREGRPFRSFEWGCLAAMLAAIALVCGLEWNSSAPDDVREATVLSGASRAALLTVVFFLLRFVTTARERLKVLPGVLLLVVFWLDALTHAPSQNPTVPGSVYAADMVAAHPPGTAKPVPGQARAMTDPRAAKVMSLNPGPKLDLNFLANRKAGRVNCNQLDHVPHTDGFYSLTPRHMDQVSHLLHDRALDQLSPLMDFLSVSQVTAAGTLTEWTARTNCMPLVSSGQQPLFLPEQATLQALTQTNLDLRQVVYLPPEARPSAGLIVRQPAARISDVAFTAHKIAFQTDSSAATLAVISQSDYPAWRALVDGRPSRLWRANHAFQAVEVPAGHHQIVLVYRDQAFRVGLALSLIGLVGCAVLWVWSRESHNTSKVCNPS